MGVIDAAGDGGIGLFQIDTSFLRGGGDAVCAGLTQAEHRIMEGGIFALFGRSQRHARGIHAFRAEDREFTHHNAQIGIGGNQRLHIGHALRAIAAGVIGKFDQRDRALGIAEHRAGERPFQFTPQRADPAGQITLLQHLHRLWQNLWMGHQVIPVAF